MQKDVYFLNHLNKENGTEDSVSKFNTFEVRVLETEHAYFTFVYLTQHHPT